MTDQQEETLGEKVDRLEGATRRLTGEIDRLGTALTRVRKLEDAQVELREQTTLAMFNALAAHDQAGANARQLDSMSEATTEKERRRRFAQRAAVLGALIVLPLVSALVYAAILHQVDGLVSRQRQDLLRGCAIRNQSVQLTIDRESRLAASAVDPAERKIHLDSAARYKALITNCEAAYNSFTLQSGS